MVKVSVVMPVYNASDYLRESVGCILNQTHEDLELICVDDGSEDNSLEILNEIADKDNRVKVFHQENRGGGAARNFALNHIDGKFLYFMDADDAIELDAFSKLIEIMQTKELDFVIFTAKNYAEDEDRYFTTPYYSMKELRQFGENRVFDFKDLGDLIFNISVTPWCKFYDAEFVKKSKAQFLENSIFHDNQFFWEVLFNAERISFINHEFYTRRVYSASSTGAGDKRYVNIINVVNNIIRLFEKYGQLDRFKHILYNKKVFWIYSRYVDIQQEFKGFFYSNMKEDFLSVDDDDFANYLDDKNRFIFESVVNSKTLREFDLLIENYELTQENLKLKNTKKLPNFLKYRVRKFLK